MAEYTDAELKEALQRVQQAREGLLEAARGRSIWDVAEQFAMDSFIELRLALDSSSPKVRFAAARELAQLWAKLPARPAVPPTAGMSKDEFDARVAAAEQEPAIREYFKRQGWTEPKQKGMGN